MWPEFPQFIAGLSSKDKLTYLNLIWHKGGLELENENDKRVISETICNWIQAPSTRYDGLMLWNVSLAKSQLYLNNWGQLLLACLKMPTSSSSNRRVALKILNQMVEKYEIRTPFISSFVQFIPHLIPCLLSNLEDNEGFVLSCESLHECMKHVPEIVGPHTLDIESFLVRNLDNEAVEVVKILAKCFALLPSCAMYYKRPQGLFSVGWENLYAKTVNTLHCLFEDISLFQSGEPRTINNREPTFTIPCDLEEGLSYLCHKVRVFSSLSQCLSELMSSESYRVKVFLKDLLELIRRVISMSNETLPHSTCLYHSRMCHVAFTLLEATILNFNVAEQTENILQMVVKASENAQLANHPLADGEVRLAVSRFLNIWMKQCGCTVSSKISSVKIAGKPLASILSSEIEINRKVLNEQTCSESIKVLSILIQSASTFFEKKVIRHVIDTILKTVRGVLLHLHPLKSLPYPYSDDNCRLELFKLLLTICVSEHPYQNNCILKSASLFKLALTDPSIEVKNVCRRACNLLVYYINPKKPPPDHTSSVSVATVDESDPENLTADFQETNSATEGNWQQGHLNGQVGPTNILPAPLLYRTDSEFQESVVDNENSLERHAEMDSPPHYVELEPSNQYNNLRTLSRSSSLSDDFHESASDEEEIANKSRKSCTESRPRKRVLNKHKHAPIGIPLGQKANRPHLQILEAHRANDVRTDDDSMDANVTAIRDVQSDQNSIEEEEEEEDVTPMPSPKRVVSENGEVEDSDEEGFDEDDEEDEEAVGDSVNEERFSPEPEVRPIKKQKFNNVDELYSEEGSNRHSAECEEIGSNEELKEERAINQEVNGEQSALIEGEQTVEEMELDFVLAEPEL